MNIVNNLKNKKAAEAALNEKIHAVELSPEEISVIEASCCRRSEAEKVRKRGKIKVKKTKIYEIGFQDLQKCTSITCIANWFNEGSMKVHDLMVSHGPQLAKTKLETEFSYYGQVLRVYARCEETDDSYNQRLAKADIKDQSHKSSLVFLAKKKKYMQHLEDLQKAKEYKQWLDKNKHLLENAT